MYFKVLMPHTVRHSIIPFFCKEWGELVLHHCIRDKVSHKSKINQSVQSFYLLENTCNMKSHRLLSKYLLPDIKISNNGGSPLNSKGEVCWIRLKCNIVYIVYKVLGHVALFCNNKECTF